jgi:hypothetical protein
MKRIRKDEHEANSCNRRKRFQFTNYNIKKDDGGHSCSAQYIKLFVNLKETCA